MNIARDDNGKILTECPYILICPVEYINEARAMASQHLKDMEGLDEPPDKMLPTPLSPNGLEPITHYGCVRLVHDREIELIRKSLALNAKSHNWVGTIDSPIDLFTCVLGTKEDVLHKVGLKVWQPQS